MRIGRYEGTTVFTIVGIGGFHCDAKDWSRFFTQPREPLMRATYPALQKSYDAVQTSNEFLFATKTKTERHEQ